MQNNDNPNNHKHESQKHESLGATMLRATFLRRRLWGCPGTIVTGGFCGSASEELSIFEKGHVFEKSLIRLVKGTLRDKGPKKL